MKYIYNITIRLYYCAIWIASFFNAKARLWIDGRKNIFERLRSKINKEDRIVWFHCASLGEFEQGRPLIEKLKVESLKLKVLVTFFSPSGYEVRKNYAGADYVFYLPPDTPGNAREFLKIVKPQMAFFVKYEFWYNYLDELKKQNIRTYLVSGIFRPEHYFFKWYAPWFRKQLGNFTFFFLQNENSKKLLESIGIGNCIVNGDTRFDSVWDTAEKATSIPLIEKFRSDKKLLIAGSTWEEDEKRISGLTFEGLKLIVAPHAINEVRIQHLVKRFQGRKTLRFSEADENTISDHDVLIIDNIGMLSSLYKYGDIAYIGGGFGKGIHNILEAAVFGIPVVFGPAYEKFNEAKELIGLKGAFSVNSQKALETTVAQMLANETERAHTGRICRNYVAVKRGASEKIITYLGSGS